MAIQVVKRGTPPTDRQVSATCHSCRSELTWKASDGQHGSCQREGEWNMIKCPVCGSAVAGNYKS